MPVRNNRNLDLNLSPALGIWVKRRNISQAEFARNMGYSPNHAHNLITNKYPFGPATFGWFIMVYGVAALEEIFGIARVSTQGRLHEEA